MENMAMIIKSIALASRSIVAGKDTPTRVKVDELRWFLISDCRF